MEGGFPKVFISYSHDTEEHQERVLALADRLRADGIDAEVDQYNESPREGWPLWCERQIAAADFVLIVCTETYRRRVMGEEQPGAGLGVVWEAAIIRHLLYGSGLVSEKFVPVLFSDSASEHIPTMIRGWTRYVLEMQDGYEKLYRRLTGQPATVRPPRGAICRPPERHREWSKAELQAAAVPDRSPSPSTAMSSADGRGNNRSSAISGNFINSAVVVGDHNITRLTVPDTNEQWRDRLRRFAASDECAEAIRQLASQFASKEADMRRSSFWLMVVLVVYMLISSVWAGTTKLEAYGLLVAVLNVPVFIITWYAVIFHCTVSKKDLG